jgi:hypothetical protein
MDLGGWLRSLGLERYEAVFRENEIDERVPSSLTQEDLKEIGVGPVGHRRILVEAIAALRADTGAKEPPADVATASSAPSGLQIRSKRFNRCVGSLSEAPRARSDQSPSC